MTLTTLATAVAEVALSATGALAQQNLTAETANAAGVPGNTVLALGEFASQAGIANIQVATGQTLTNSLQNVAEGKTDITAAPFILPFLMSRGAGPYAKLGAEAGANLDPVLIPQHHIEQDQVDPPGVEVTPDFRLTAGGQGNGAVPLQILDQHLPCVVVIIHDQQTGNRHLTCPSNPWGVSRTT